MDTTVPSGKEMLGPITTWKTSSQKVNKHKSKEAGNYTIVQNDRWW